MISHGDEIGRTQDGNNNVYCQDSELSWMDWSLCRDERRPAEFTRKVDRAAQGAPGVPAAPVLRGQADPHRRTGPRHRLADPGGQEMTPRTGAPGLASASRCSSTARRSRRPTRAASASSTTRSCCASTPTTRRWISSRPHGDYAQRMDRRTGHRRPQRATPTGGHGRREDLAAAAFGARAAQDRPDAHARAPVLSTYRLQMRGDALHLRRRRGPARLPRRSRGLAPVPVPDPDRGARARRTVRRHRSRPRCRRNWAAPTGWPGCRRRRATRGLGVIVDIVPNHVGVDEPAAEPVVVGRARRTAGSRRTPRISTSTGHWTRRPNRVAGAGFRRRRRRPRGRR